MKIAITCPVYLKNVEHRKYLHMTTNSIISRDHDVVFIPVENYVDNALLPLMYNFTHEPELIDIVKGGNPQSVASAWNKGIEEGVNKGCEYILVINTDIVFKSNALDRLVAFAVAHPEAIMWTMSEYADLGGIEDCPEDENFSEHPHFSCFMVKRDFFSYVGRFDENFRPAYCEDGDMHARISLANKKAYIYGGARFFHFGSRTIKSDSELWRNNTQTFPRNQEYFLKKWGHPIVGDAEEMRKLYYKTPYNEPNRGLDYWRLESEVK